MNIGSSIDLLGVLEWKLLGDATKLSKDTVVPMPISPY